MGHYVFTVPLRFREECHPLGIGPDDLFVVEAESENGARAFVNRTLGNHTWCSTMRSAGTELDTYRAKFARGRIVDLEGQEVEL